jgi:hypothetical protein
MEKGKKKSGLIDDLDFGPPFVYARTIYENNLVDILEPLKLLNNKFIKPEKNSKLDRIITDLHNNDNPIIRIIKTKTNI